MRVAITGSHGLIGSALTTALSADGVEVVRVVRGAAQGHDVMWDPSTGTIGADAFNGIDAVVHLAGEGVAEKRWTAAQKAKVLDSRRVGTDAIARACASAKDGPRVLVSGSAIGFYGDTHGDVVDEKSGPGHDFLAGVCRAWEAATEPAGAAGVRVVNIRTAIVQTARGGMLGKQLLPFRLGLGARLGSGKQWVSWITLEDEVRAIRFAIDNEMVRGPLNLSAPEPVTNAVYAKALGRALHRPAVLVVPPVALKLVLGAELVKSLLVSQRVAPTKLLDAGFVFAHPAIDEGLRAALGA
jgi:hypothetical protein